MTPRSPSEPGRMSNVRGSKDSFYRRTVRGEGCSGDISFYRDEAADKILSDRKP
jgi:hypothetical protein